MKALVLYAVMVVGGALIASLIGLYAERQFGATVSLIVFLTLFFANFAVSWLLTLLIMDGPARRQA